MQYKIPGLISVCWVNRGVCYHVSHNFLFLSFYFFLISEHHSRKIKIRSMQYKRGKTINKIALGCTERVNVHLFRLHNMITLLIEKPPAIHIRFSRYRLHISVEHIYTYFLCAHTNLMGCFFLSILFLSLSLSLSFLPYLPLIPGLITVWRRNKCARKRLENSLSGSGQIFSFKFRYRCTNVSGTSMYAIRFTASQYTLYRLPFCSFYTCSAPKHRYMGRKSFSICFYFLFAYFHFPKRKLCVRV